MTVNSETTAERAPERPAAPSTATGSPGPTGERLVDPASDQWSGSFDACFQANYARVLAYCLRRIGDRPTAEDVAAQTFVVAWRRRDVLPVDGLPWLLGIARHVILGERRSDRRRHRLLLRLAAEPMPTDVGPEPMPNAPTGIAAALAQLSESDREVLLLTTWDGLDQSRAAAVLGCSPAAFRVRLHRARKRLACALDDVSYTSEENS